MSTNVKRDNASDKIANLKGAAQRGAAAGAAAANVKLHGEEGRSEIRRLDVSVGVVAMNLRI